METFTWYQCLRKYSAKPARVFNYILYIFILISGISCKKESPTVSNRSYRMGFQISGPANDYNTYISALKIWTLRADAAIISFEVPWDSLLNGETPETYVSNTYKSLTEYYRSLNFKVWVYVDPENGLNRSSDADALLARGKSIAHADMQQIYIRYCLALDSILHPDHMGFALETNLIRLSAPDSIYQGVRLAANAAAMAVTLRDPVVKMSVSIQLETAWGYLTGSSYLGIHQDLSDFPFIRELGLSSYPYFNITSPSLLPDNYYSRIQQESNLPVFISEGGWTSQTITGYNGLIIKSDTRIQADYLSKQNRLLENAGALAVFQLTFTDLDLGSLPPTVPVSIKYFAYLGLVDIQLMGKPSLVTWDSAFKRPLLPDR